MSPREKAAAVLASGATLNAALRAGGFTKEREGANGRYSYVLGGEVVFAGFALDMSGWLLAVAPTSPRDAQRVAEREAEETIADLEARGVWVEPAEQSCCPVAMLRGERWCAYHDDLALEADDHDEPEYDDDFAADLILAQQELEDLEGAA